MSGHLDPEPDVIHVQQLPAMVPLLRLRRPLRNVFFDIDDVAHRILLREIRQTPLQPGKLASLAHLPALLNVERQASAMSTLSFVCSELDRQHLRRLGIAGKVVVVPNAVPVPEDPPGVTASPTLLFLGACDYPPNIMAAERLVTRIFTLIRRRVSNARLMIAGKHSLDLPSRQASPPGVEYMGFVDDIDALYTEARIVCCPITTGGGTRVKLIEAAAYARPMVATHVAAEGLAFVDGEEILLRDDDTGLVEACVSLLRDDQECARLGQAARMKMQRLYDAAAIRAGVARLMRDHLSAPDAPRPRRPGDSHLEFT